ncbi:MAG: 2-oxo-3-deoxygalactonate kinase [Sphingomonas sp.]|nr:2-oxo-3-deoxygalactonate kinase [Sphingomonas sp.]
MSETAAYIAVDWGTTNRRIWAVAASGYVVAAAHDDHGVLAVTPGTWAQEIAEMRDRFGALPVLAAGMVGSDRGWCSVPYVGLPTAIATLASGVVRPAEDVAIIPGVARTAAERPDVMRGEEIQLLGAIAAGVAPGDAIFCQPGTHNKWMTAYGGQIVDFTTAMTGELFALLRGGGVLMGMLDAPVADGPAFRQGLERGIGAVDLIAALFEVRARVLLGALAGEDAASFASGVLIGSDVGARRELPGHSVYLLASGPLAGLYAAAIETVGARPVLIDGEQAFRSGIHALWEKLQ